MIPRWKIAREARRLREKIKALVLKPVYTVRQRYHDRTRAHRVKVRAGDRALTEHVVVLLVYQPKGLPASLFHTLNHIHTQGFSAFVVLNSIVSAADMQKLCAHAALVMERPNFGYDFGGYRDAILHLAQQPDAFNTLTCLNDSIWYPVFETCDHLQRMAQLDGALIGYSYAKGLRNHKNAHVQSYFFMFRGANFLKSHDFNSFWLNLRVSDSRYFTIRNSEMQMTHYFSGHGHKIGWLFSADDIKYEYERCAPADLELTEGYLRAIGHKLAPNLARAKTQGAENLRSAILEGFDSGTLSRNVIGFEPVILYKGAGFGAMKKSSARNYAIQRRLAMTHSVVDGFAPNVAAEICESDSKFN